MCSHALIQSSVLVLSPLAHNIMGTMNACRHRQDLEQAALHHGNPTECRHVAMYLRSVVSHVYGGKKPRVMNARLHMLLCCAT